MHQLIDHMIVPPHWDIRPGHLPLHYLPPMVLTSGVHHWRPVQTFSLEALTPILTSSGGHRNMCG